MNAARFFIIASLAFGTAMIFLTPPFCAPDEPAHIYHAWSISRGHIVVHGGDAIPSSIVVSAATLLRMTRGASTERITWSAMTHLARLPLLPEATQFVAVPRDPDHQPLGYTASSYPPIAYLATASLVAAGRALRLSPVVLVYLCRFANLALATLLIGWAIRMIPFGRWTLALLALTPMAVFMRAGLGADALTTAFVIALVAAILDRRVAWTLVLTFLVCAIKPGYSLIPLFVLSVPELRKRPAVTAGVLVALIAGTAVAAFFLRNADPSLGRGGNSRLTAAIHHPLAYGRELTEELQRDAALLAVEAVADFGWLDAPAPLAFALVWMAGLIAMAVIDGPSPLTAGGRSWSLLLAAAQGAALMSVFHVTAAGGDFIRGLQGRYFLPLLPLALLPLAMISVRDAAKVHLAQILMGIAAAQSVWILLTRYWI